MILSRAALRIQMTADATPTLPGVSGPVPMGQRLVTNFETTEDLHAIWGLDISNITSGNTPVVNFATGAVTPDSAVVAGNTAGLNFEGVAFGIATLKVLMVEITGALLTATVAGAGLLARLPVGTHCFSGASLAEWAAAVTLAAPTGTGAIKFTAFGESI